MIRKLMLSVAGIAFSITLLAQAYIGEVPNRRTRQAAAAIRLPYTKQSVEDALQAWLKRKGYRSTDTHGYILSREVPLNGAAAENKDLYFLAATPARKDKELTVLSLVPMRRNQDIATAITDSSSLDGARVFLDSLAPFIATYNTNLRINSGQDELKKAQRKMDDLLSDQSSLQKRLRDYQADLDENKIEQTRTTSLLQTATSADDGSKGKYQKMVNKLIDRQETLEKKIRNTQSDLADNSAGQKQQQERISQLRQSLDAIKGIPLPQ